MSKIIEVIHLHTCFQLPEKEVTVVEDVSFDINEGEVFGLIGESGCGKSVTCRSLIGLIQKPGRVKSGSILYKGKELTSLTEKQWSDIRGSEIGMIFQEPMTTLNPVTSIYSQLTESMGKLGLTKQQKREKAIELLRLVGISDPESRLDCYPHQLSGGMRQRVMIAIVLAANPKLILADEPTTALDVTIQDQIMKLLLELKKKLQVSMILVTHNLGVAKHMCDRIAVMYAGRIMEIATKEELFRNPKHPYTNGLMRSIPALAQKGEKIWSIKGMPPNMAELKGGCPFAPRCDMCTENCFQQIPELVKISDDHMVRCHMVKKE